MYMRYKKHKPYDVVRCMKLVTLLYGFRVPNCCMALQTPALLFGLLLIYNPNFAFAATGGRVGCGLFPSSGKSPSSKSSQSHSSSHSPPRSYSTIPPLHDSSLLPPTFTRSPLHSPPIPPSTMTRSPSSSSDNFSGFMTFLAIAVGLAFYRYWTMVRRTTTVVKFQVGLLGTAVSLQKDLNQITETADTSTSTGLSYVLTETTTSLLCNLDHCISSYTSVAQKYEIEEAEDFFRQLSTGEMAKFDEETLVNMNNMKTSSRGQSSHELHREYMVVTILVAAQGVHKVPTINGTRDLKKALQNLGSIPTSEIVAVEVLWTPQQENDTLTEKELLKGYPDLRGFYEEASKEEGPYEEQQPFLGASVRC